MGGKNRHKSIKKQRINRNVCKEYAQRPQKEDTPQCSGLIFLFPEKPLSLQKIIYYENQAYISVASADF